MKPLSRELIFENLLLSSEISITIKIKNVIKIKNNHFALNGSQFFTITKKCYGRPLESVRSKFFGIELNTPFNWSVARADGDCINV